MLAGIPCHIMKLWLLVPSILIIALRLFWHSGNNRISVFVGVLDALDSKHQ